MRTTTDTPPSFACAVAAAQAGRYGEALRTLDGLGGSSSEDPAVLDLLARIHAQRGELAEADACWARAQEVDPRLATTTSAFSAGRRRIAALQAARYRPAAGRRLLTTALILVAAGAVATTALPPLSPGPAPPEPVPGKEWATVQAMQNDLDRQLIALKADLDTLTRNPRQSIDRLAAALRAPGTTVTRRGDLLLITFAEGLFIRGEAPDPAGIEKLTALGRRLKQSSVTGPLVITGHATDTPPSPTDPYPDRITLGFARSQVAARTLSTASGIPLSAIGIRSTGTANPPFPNDSPANRSRNNTVTLLIGPAGEADSSRPDGTDRPAGTEDDNFRGRREDR